jgi:hypothetical protein
MTHLFDVCERCWSKGDDNNRAICGRTLRGVPSGDVFPVDCVVCVDLAAVTPCPVCGVIPQ